MKRWSEETKAHRIRIGRNSDAFWRNNKEICRQENERARNLARQGMRYRA